MRLKVKRLTVHLLWIGLALWAVPFAPAAAQTVGEILPPWSPGSMDIHHINTGKGDAAFAILPDGTTLLIDAGAGLRSGPRITPQKPDSSRTPGGWIARYVEHMLEDRPDRRLDYALLTHFHGDHMGEVSEESERSESGDYLLTGITEVGESIPISKLIDRGWPDYDYPLPLDSPTMDNYRRFVAWQIEHRGMAIDRFQPGRDDQIVLTHNPERYPSFEVQNIAVNGEIWMGRGTETAFVFPPLDSIPDRDKPGENEFSAVMVIRYGRFDYYNGGDIPGVPEEGAPSWLDIETPVARVVGPVDVHVVDHHGTTDSANPFFLSTLQPRVHILSVWAPSHPGLRVLRRLNSTRLYPGPRDIFATNIMEATRIVQGDSIDVLKSSQGHILVRVAPGGDSYTVIILDDSAETYKVTAVHGPYQAR